MSSKLARLAWKGVPPVALFLLVLLVWGLAVYWFQPAKFLLPGPLEVARVGIQNAPQIGAATCLTAVAAVTGFVGSLVLGVMVALLFSQSPIIRASCYPYAIFLQTVPIVAIAPLVITWSGYGLRSVMIVAGVISLFPIITNATTGMLAVAPALLELFELHHATRWQQLVKLRLPNSVPYLVAGAKTSSGLAVVGAIVGEFFVGAGTGQCGLGFLIRRELEQLHTAALFAAVIGSTVLSVAIFGAVHLAGATILSRWYQPDARR